MLLLECGTHGGRSREEITIRQDGKSENSILIVAAQPAASRWLQQCGGRGWSGIATGLCNKTAASLRAFSPTIVLTQDVLPDGTWRDVFQSAAAIRPEAVRVVCSGQSTLRLWMDVLAQGGRELLPEPCPDELLVHVLSRYDRMKAERCALA